jgi:phage regulator Rha-like protein
MAKAKLQLGSTLPDESIISKIYLIRGQKVMLDKDLAEMYGVATKVFNQTIKRNLDRFPSDFMFQLTREEYAALRSQIVTLENGGRGKFSKYDPYAFTEQGVSMLSGVLNSPVAIQVHIQIIRVFTKMKELLLTNKDILLKLEKMEKNVEENKEDIANIFRAIKQLLETPKLKRNTIGFKPDM